MERCYRHSDVETGVSCSRCGRAICTDCMTASPVGMRCPECTGRSETQKVLGLPSASGRPVATIGIIISCAIMFLLSGAGQQTELLRLLALYAPPVADGELFRLISYGFLHGSIIHIFFNLMLVWFLGSQMEMELGSARFLAIYFVSLVFGALGALLLSPMALTVGASGAVYGLMGCFVLILWARGINPFQTGLGVLLLLNLGLSFVIPGVSIGGHLGGLLGGALMGGVFLLSERRQWTFPVLSAALFVAAIVLSVLIASAY